MSELEPVIQQTEGYRLNGLYEEAVFHARLHGSVDPANLASLPESEHQDLMRLWRIWTVSLLAYSQQQLSGTRSGDKLMQAHSVVDRYYLHPISIQRAPGMHTDPNGAVYEMEFEMLRDRAKLTLYLARLTGNTQLLQKAIELSDQVITHSQAGSSVWGLGVMERQRLGKSLGERVDAEKFGRAYDAVVDNANSAGGNDRLATASGWFIFTSLQKLDLSNAKKGWQNLVTAAKAMGKSPVKYLLKDAIRGGVNVWHRLTLSDNVKQSLIFKVAKTEK